MSSLCLAPKALIQLPKCCPYKYEETNHSDHQSHHSSIPSKSAELPILIIMNKALILVLIFALIAVASAGYLYGGGGYGGGYGYGRGFGYGGGYGRGWGWAPRVVYRGWGWRGW